MNSKIKHLYTVLVCLLLLAACAKKEIPKGYLIEIEAFIELSKNENTKIIDFRKSAAYKNGHLKNSLNIWRTDIEDDSYPYGGMKASKEQLEKLFRKLGINKNDTLLILDDKGLCDAARLWWVLQYYKFTNVKLLNGGFETVKTAGIPLTKDETPIVASNFSFGKAVNKEFYASKAQIEYAIKNNHIIIDTRTTEEFLGNVLKKGATSKGKIPTSTLIDWAKDVDYHGNKKMKSISELKKIYTDINHNSNDTVYVYCHSGVRSAHTTFVLTQVLGYKHVLNYDGSWTEWSYLKNQDK